MIVYGQVRQVTVSGGDQTSETRVRISVPQRMGTGRFNRQRLTSTVSTGVG